MRKVIKKCLLTLLFAASLLTPVQAEGEDFQAFFTWIGMRETSEISSTVYPYEGSTFACASAWKQETVYLKAAVTALADTHISVSADSFIGRNGEDTLPCNVGFLKSTSVSLGMGTDEWIPHIDVPDIITEEKEKDLSAGERAYIWISVPVGETASGSYRGTIHVSGTVHQELNAEIVVGPYSLADQTISLDLWQYPFSSYYRYDALRETEPFSSEHLEILSKELDIYRSIGGSHITCAITEEPWAHQTYFDTPSLVKWNVDGNGFLWFDYTWFDAWVELCRSKGIDGPIDCFSILPFDHVITVWNDMGAPDRIVLTPGDEQWKWYWENFLYSFTAHLEEKGWLDDTYLFVDERGLDYFYFMTDYVRSLNLGSRLHFAAALNVIPRDAELYDRFDYLSISIASVPEQDEEFNAFLSHRKELGLTTTMYNCSTNYPNAFGYSDPYESVWSLQYLAMRGFDGYLRWAFNAWPSDPLVKADNPHFEAGDTFLIYPDDISAADPGPSRSVRLCMIEQGINDMKKYRYLLRNADEETTALLRSGFDSMKRCYGSYNAYGAMGAASDGNRAILATEVMRMEMLIQKAALNAALNERGTPVSSLKEELNALCESQYQPYE